MHGISTNTFLELIRTGQSNITKADRYLAPTKDGARRPSKHAFWCQPSNPSGVYFVVPTAN